MKAWLFVIVLATVPVLAQTKSDAAKPKPAQVISTFQDSAYVTGVWRPDNSTKKNELVEGVVEISCFKHGGEELVRTEAFCLQATATMVNEMLVPSTQWLRVSEWSDVQIIASDDSSICVTSQTIIDLRRKTAIALDVRKPEAKGLNNACDLVPDRQTYYLQEVVDYYARKRVDSPERTESRAKINDTTVPVRVDENGVSKPSCLYCPEPQYSEDARKSKFQGSVLVQVTIQADGHATDIHVVKNVGLGLDEKAIEAVRTWRFKPAIGPNGTPVAATTTLEVNFRLL